MKMTVESPSLERARELVLAHGWNATAYQILNPGLQLWFARTGDAVVGFTIRDGVCIVAGAPICRHERLPAVAREWEAFARKRHSRVCYFGAGERLEIVLRRAGYSKVLLGAQPTWNPRDWEEVLSSRASLRAQLNRARNKSVAVSLWDNERTQNDVALRRCLKNWLARQGLPSMHFLVEPRLLDHLLDRRILVAERDGKPIGFALLSPIAARNGWLIEQIVRDIKAPNGTSELLVDAALRWSHQNGAEYITMGLTPLSRRTDDAAATHHPLWLDGVLHLMRAHCRRFYNFDGLETFKAKFGPQAWEPIYAISNEARFSPRTLHAIAAAFSSGSPEILMMHALGKALGIEIETLQNRASKYFEARNGG